MQMNNDDTANTFIQIHSHDEAMDDTRMIRDMRYLMGESQAEFWRRFGVSQTRGSRFEQGAPIPQSVLMLLRLYLLSVIDDRDLHRAGDPACALVNRLDTFHFPGREPLSVK